MTGSNPEAASDPSIGRLRTQASHRRQMSTQAKSQPPEGYRSDEMKVDFSKGDIKGELKDGVNLSNQEVEQQYKQEIFSDLEALQGTVYDEDKVPRNTDRNKEGYKVEVVAGDETTFDMSQ